MIQSQLGRCTSSAFHQSKQGRTAAPKPSTAGQAASALSQSPWGPSLGKGKTTKDDVKGTDGILLFHGTELLLFLWATTNSHSKFHGSDWNSSRERKNYLWNNRLWSNSEEAGRGVAGGSCPELTEEFSQVLAIYNPSAN